MPANRKRRGGGRSDRSGGSKRKASGRKASGRKASGRKASGRGPLTKEQLEGDTLVSLAKETWAGAEVGALQLDMELVTRIYTEELGGVAEAGSPGWKSRAKVLELTQYLEQYLWPLYEPGSEAATAAPLVMSIVALVNVKTSLGLNAFGYLAERSGGAVFAGFFDAVLEIGGRAAGPDGNLVHAIWTVEFLINAVGALENDAVSGAVLPLVSLPVWAAIPVPRRAQALDALTIAAPHMAKLWAKMWKMINTTKVPSNASKAAKRATVLRASSWVPALVDGVLERAAAVAAGSDAEPGVLALLEKLLVLLIDLVSQLPTRRFFNTFIRATHLTVKLRALALVRSHSGLCSLLDLLEFYVHFELNDYTGEALLRTQADSRLSDKVSAAQAAAALTDVPEIHALALVNHASFTRPDLLKDTVLVSFDEPGLETLLLLLRITDADGLASLRHVADSAGAMSWRDMLLGVLVFEFAARDSQLESINKLPLLPTETDLYDPVYELVGPDGGAPRAGAAASSHRKTHVYSLMPSSVALPKLGLQFLSLYDYLLRNFHLFRLEANYEVRSDVEKALRVMRPVGAGPELRFRGWAKMGLVLAQPPKVGKVLPPKLGALAPRRVTLAVEYSLDGVAPHVAEQWDSLRSRDVVFFLAVTRGPAKPIDDTVSGRDAYGLEFIRGGEVIAIYDEKDEVLPTFDAQSGWGARGGREPAGVLRRLVVELDAAQFYRDVQALGSEDAARRAYAAPNVVLRRDPKENNFKAVLHTMRALMNSSTESVPRWLHEIFLGFGRPDSAHYTALLETPWAKVATSGGLADGWTNYVDTFLDAEHLETAVGGVFGGAEIVWEPADDGSKATRTPPFALKFDASASKVHVKSYAPRVYSPYERVASGKANQVPFTARQVEGIRGGLNPGLNVIVGPPGTGKTDVAVQIVNGLYHNYPGQRTLLITHSNQALNQLFAKIVALDIDEKDCVRLGHGTDALDVGKDFSKYGRVDHMLAMRLKLLSEVARLARALGLDDDAATEASFSVSAAGRFYLLHVGPATAKYQAVAQGATTAKAMMEAFPFAAFFADVDMTKATTVAEARAAIELCLEHVEGIFIELEETRPFELLRSGSDRGNHLVTTQARIIAMTCTHAALKWPDMVQRLRFKFDNVVMEEAGQILEVETFIPLMLQTNDVVDGHRLKRVTLIGDHHQLPPVVKNPLFASAGNLDQSMFARLVKLGVPAVVLDKQGRMRPELRALFSWRYAELGDLPMVTAPDTPFSRPNPGFAKVFQVVNVEDYQGEGERTPSPYFYQNLGEAEYVAATYMYMRSLGYPAESIAVLTSYNGQRALLHDVLAARCGDNPLYGMPGAISTVDKFQGQQADYVLLSLVRTRSIGHIRDVRRLVVALSRARLGLYVFCRLSLFRDCYELAPAFDQLIAAAPDAKLLLCEAGEAGEAGSTDEAAGVSEVEDVAAMGKLVYDRTIALLQQAEQAQQQGGSGEDDMGVAAMDE